MWNFRVVKTKEIINDEEYVYFGIHEAFYYGDEAQKNLTPSAITENSIRIDAESLEDLKWMIDKIKMAFDMPVIDYDEVGRDKET